ncbi:MAG: tetratricopeptide repeat protein [Sandaracinaceae bacterium]
MGRLKEVSSASAPEDYLRRARDAPSWEERAAYASDGLARASADPDAEVDTRFLLLRQLYLAQLEGHRFREALSSAEAMAALGPMRDVAHHDASRVHIATGDLPAAVSQQRLAARSAPPDRRSFQLWNLANLLHRHGDLDGALGALERAERWSKEDRPLIVAHRAWIDLQAGRAVEGLDRIVATLEASRVGAGIGRWVLGMIAHEMGDRRAAAVHLRAFLRRHSAADAVQSIALREELRLARTTLASIESD